MTYLETRKDQLRKGMDLGFLLVQWLLKVIEMLVNVPDTVHLSGLKPLVDL